MTDSRVTDSKIPWPALPNDRSVQLMHWTCIQAPSEPVQQQRCYECYPGQSGGLTYQAEGSSSPSSPYFSRRAHVPSARSGVTIGRGFDMRERSADEIVEWLTGAGLAQVAAERFRGAAGLSGDGAREYVAMNDLPEITDEQERRLFNSTYKFMESDVLRIISKADVLERYGVTAWKDLDCRMREVIVDLRYRGDYTPQTREFLQPAIVANDFGAFKQLMANRELWLNVPHDRFNRRLDALGGN